MMATNMNPGLYKALKNGDITFIQKRARDIECSLLLDRSPNSNTILHVAASSGHYHLVKEILSIQQCQQLVTAKNSTGNLALHVAASAGNLSIVRLLVSSYHYQQLKSGPLRETNKEGNTPLHMALINKYQDEMAVKTKYNEVAKFLVNTADPEVSYYPNIEGKSPLYMAAEAGDAELVNIMKIKATHHPDVNGKSIVQAAIYGAFTTKNIGNFPTSLYPSTKNFKFQGVSTHIQNID